MQRSKLQQSGWFMRGSIKARVRRQHWSAILFGISSLGVFLATVLLIADHWADALAVYLASGLALAVLLSNLAGREAEQQAAEIPECQAAEPGIPQASLTLKSSPWA